MRIGCSRSRSDHAAKSVHDGLGRDPGSRRAREQPARHQPRHPEAAADRLHRACSGSGKSSLVFETIAAESQRLINETYSAFVQGFMGTPPRPDVDSLENLTRGDHRRPGAHGRQRALDRRHGDRRLRHAARSSSAASGSRTSARPPRSASTFRPARSAARSRSSAARRQTEAREITISRRHVRRVRGARAGSRPSTSTRSSTATRASTRARSPSRGSASAPGTTASSPTRASSTPTSRCATSPMPNWSACSTAPRRRSRPSNINLTYRASSTRSAARTSSRTSTSLQPSLRARRRAHLDLRRLPLVRRHAAQRAARSSLIDGRNIAECRGDADQRPRRRSCAASTTPGVAADRSTPCWSLLDSMRPHRPRLPEPRPRVVDAVGRRGAAHEDGPPPRLVPDRRDLRLRRADDRPPRPRRGADERACCSACATRATPSSWSSTTPR